MRKPDAKGKSWVTGDLDPKLLTEEQLERHLLTCDFRGAKYKSLCLEEIRKRVRQEPKNAMDWILCMLGRVIER